MSTITLEDLTQKLQNAPASILEKIWGYDYYGDTRTVDVHINRLREKIKDNPHWSIATVWGIGYKFEVKNP